MHFSCGHPYLDYHSTQGGRSIADGSFTSQAGYVKGWLWPGVPSSGVSPAALPKAKAHGPGWETKDTAVYSQANKFRLASAHSHEQLMNGFHLPLPSTHY